MCEVYFVDNYKDYEVKFKNKTKSYYESLFMLVDKQSIAEDLKINNINDDRK